MVGCFILRTKSDEKLKENVLHFNYLTQRYNIKLALQMFPNQLCGQKQRRYAFLLSIIICILIST